MTPPVQEALTLRARYDEEPSHSDHVALLALQIFDGLQSWHGYNSRQRDLLYAAALLHDIGWSQTPDGKGHHKWSEKLIRQHTWKSLTPEEVPIIGQIARYHRKSPPQADHAEFHALPAPARKLIMVLGGILRIADALDRTHTGKIESLEASFVSDAILIQVKPIGTWKEELSMFETKRDMLQAAAGQPVRCEAQESL